MNKEINCARERHMTSIFERYLTVWVGLCILGGILLGKAAPNLAKTLDGMAITVHGAALATVVGVLIKVPVMLMLVEICLRAQHWFPRSE